MGHSMIGYLLELVLPEPQPAGEDGGVPDGGVPDGGVPDGGGPHGP